MVRNTSIIDPLNSSPCWKVLSSIPIKKTLTIEELKKKTQIKESSLYAYISVLSGVGLIESNQIKKGNKKKAYLNTGKFHPIFLKWVKKRQLNPEFAKWFARTIEENPEVFNEIMRIHVSRIPFPMQTINDLFESFIGFLLGFQGEGLQEVLSSLSLKPQ